MIHAGGVATPVPSRPLDPGSREVNCGRDAFAADWMQGSAASRRNPLRGCGASLGDPRRCGGSTRRRGHSSHRTTDDLEECPR
jgi:hypothetical protein